MTKNVASEMFVTFRLPYAREIPKAVLGSDSDNPDTKRKRICPDSI